LTFFGGGVRGILSTGAPPTKCASRATRADRELDGLLYTLAQPHLVMLNNTAPARVRMPM